MALSEDFRALRWTKKRKSEAIAKADRKGKTEDMTMYYEINGNILPQVRLADRAVLEPPYVHKTRKPDEYILYVMKKGTLYLSEGGRDYALGEGDIILLDPDFVHRGIRASNCEYYYVHFRHPQFRRLQADSGFLQNGMRLRSESLQEDRGSFGRYRDSWLRFPKMLHMRTGKSYLTVVSLLESAMERNVNQMENYKVACACRIMEAFVEIAREAVSAGILEVMPEIPDSSRKVHELLNYLNANYREHITGSLIEEKFSCNFDYLNRVFRKNIGKTIFVYLNETRIHHAQELLATTSMKVSAIGYRVGFHDESYFSKVFKKYAGVSPAQYEKMVAIRNGPDRSAHLLRGT